MRITFFSIFLIFSFFNSIAQQQIGQDIYGEASSDQAGNSISISANGKRLAIASKFYNNGTSNSGHVRVFELIDQSWEQMGENINGSPILSGWFGNSVSLSAEGTTVVIGAPLNNPNGANSGLVRIYDWLNGSWVQRGLDINGDEESYQSGFSVAISADGNRVVIGAIQNNSDPGLVRIYDWINGSWEQIGQDINGENNNDDFGHSLSISDDGNRVAIGAINNHGESFQAGNVRVFELLNGIWVQIGQDLDGTEDYQNFGESVSLSADGSRLIIGAYKDDTNGGLAGKVLVFEWVINSWIQIGQDLLGDISTKQLGKSVSLSDNGQVIAIGANGGGYGKARIFNYQNGLWVQIGQDILGDNFLDNFGHSISIAGNGSSVAISSLFNNGASGQVRVHRCQSLLVYSNTPACIGENNGSISVQSFGMAPLNWTFQLVNQAGELITENTFTTDEFSIDNLAPGLYEFIILDESGNFIRSTNVEVTGILGTLFEIESITTTNSVNEFSNGGIEIHLQGGVPNFTFTYSGPMSGTDVITTDVFSYENIPAGDYSFIITDNNLNTIVQDITVLDETNPEQTCNLPLDIIILNDVSSSVDAIEYEESKTFFVDLINALNVGMGDEATHVAIAEWSENNNQELVIPLTGNLNSLQNYTMATRSFGGGTNPNAALTFGYDYLNSSGREDITKILILSTDGTSGQVSPSLIALSEQYQAEGYVVVTIAFDDAFSNPATQSILQQTATLEVLAPGAPAYSQLTQTLAETIVNVYICAADPGATNTYYFNRDGHLEINSYSIPEGDCAEFEYINIEFTISALQQLALPAGTPISFYHNNPEIAGSTPILTSYLPCALAAGESETLIVTLPVFTATDIWAVLNDNGTQAPPISVPNTSIDELVYVNNFDNISICVDPIPTVSVFKYTTTPTPICDNVVIYTVDVCNISGLEITEVLVEDQAPAGFELINTVINNNGCAIGSNPFNLGIGCCASITYTYNASNATIGAYTDQDAIVSGPSGQSYNSYNGQTSMAEDVFITGEIDCPSDEVTFIILVDQVEVCDDQFISCTFEITNVTNIPLQNIEFNAIIPQPAIWASEPYFVTNASIGSTSINNTTNALFQISEIPSNSTAIFSIDIFLGEWTNSGSFSVEAFLSQLPNFINGNGETIEITSPTINVNAGPILILPPEIVLTIEQSTLIELSMQNGQNPIWTTGGDGTFDDNSLTNPTYTLGPEDIANGQVTIAVEAENIFEGCNLGSAFTNIIIDLPCIPIIETEESFHICQGESITVFGEMITETTVVEHTFVTSDGCDSLHQVSVTVSELLESSEEIVACEGDPVDVFGNPIFDSGVYENIYSSQNGCDSVHQIDVTFHQVFNFDEVIDACDGDVIEIYGDPVSESGVFEYIFSSQNGCDSIHLFEVNFSSSIYTNETINACEDDVVEIFGDTIITNDVFEESYTSTFGCDSIHQIEVIFNSIINVEEIIIACEGDIIGVFGNTISQNGIFEEIFTSSFGCDSIHQIEVIFNSAFSINETISACAGDIIEVFGNPISESGTYENTFVASNGCDSLHQIDINFTPTIDYELVESIEVIDQFDHQLPLYISSSNVNVLWDSNAKVDCPTCPNPFFNITASELFTVTLTDEFGCMVLDSILVNIHEDDCGLYIPNIFSPNGDNVNDIFTIDINPYCPVTIVRIEIFNRWGGHFYGADYLQNGQGWDGLIKGKKAQSGVYAYILELQYPDGTIQFRAGDVFLNR